MTGCDKLSLRLPLITQFTSKSKDLNGPGLCYLERTVEFLFKRHFWIVHLLFIFGVMLMVARTGNAFIGVTGDPAPQGQGEVAAAEGGPPRRTPRSMATRSPSCSACPSRFPKWR